MIPTRSNEILRAITERGTPLEWMTIGSKQDVENMSIRRLKHFIKIFTLQTIQYCFVQNIFWSLF